MLLIHPWGARSEFWDDCIPLLSKDFRCVTCDLRGAGKTPVAEGPWTVDDHVDELVDLVANLGVERLIIIACAIGSLIAARYAALEPDRVAGLILCGTAPVLGEESRVRTQARLDQVAEKGIGVLLPTVVDMAFEGQPRDARYDRYLAMFAANDPKGYISIASGMMGTDNRALLPRITCPTLVVAGGHDRLLPPSMSEAVHHLVPQSEFVVMEDAAHFPPFQAPEAFCDLVTDFLARRVPGADAHRPSAKANEA